MEKISFSDSIIQVIIQLAPAFLVICVVFIIFSWVRLAVDAMSGRGM